MTQSKRSYHAYADLSLRRLELAAQGTSGVTKAKYDILRTHENKEPYFRTWAENLGVPLTRTVAHIPARSGSSRVKHKNIREVNGLPLLAYTILVANTTPGIDRVILDTDSADYAAIGREFGADVPFLRPPELAQKYSPSQLATYNLYRHLMDEDYPVRQILCLYPTSPFRNVSMLKHAVECLKRFGAVMSCYRVANGEGYYIEDEIGRLAPMTQRPPGLGGVYPIKTLGSFIGQNLTANLYTPKNRCYVEITNPIELVDIDTEEDFMIMKSVLERSLYDFGCKLW